MAQGPFFYHSPLIFFALLALVLLTATPSLAKEEAYCDITKFGNVKPRFSIGNDVILASWKVQIVTDKHHAIYPHNPDFEPGFVPKEYPNVNPTLLYNSVSTRTCGNTYVADPTKPLTEMTCTSSAPISLIHFDSVSIALLPGVDNSTQPDPEVKFIGFDEEGKVILEQDWVLLKKPFGTSDYQTSACSECLFTGATGFLNTTAANHLQFTATFNSNRKNTPDNTFTLELSGKEADDFLFLIHDPEFGKKKVSSAPLLTELAFNSELGAIKTTTMYVMSHNTTRTAIQLDLSETGRRLRMNPDSNPLPVSQNFIFSLPSVYVIRNPERAAAQIVEAPKLRLGSHLWQAEVTHSLNFTPTFTQDWEEPKSDHSKTNESKGVPVVVFVLVVVLALVIVVGLGLKLFSLRKALAQANQEPLLMY